MGFLDCRFDDLGGRKTTIKCDHMLNKTCFEMNEECSLTHEVTKPSLVLRGYN